MYRNNDNMRDIEVSYNMVRTNQVPGQANPAFYANPSNASGPLYVHHNTFIGAFVVWTMNSADGPFYFYNNTIVNSSPGTPAGSHTSLEDVSDPARVIRTDNLVGYPADGIVDTNQTSPTLGNLTATYDEYIGLRGHQLDLSAPAPSKKLNRAIDSNGNFPVFANTCTNLERSKTPFRHRT